MNVTAFYTEVLESFGITVVDDQLYTGTPDALTPISVFNKDKDTDMIVFLPTDNKLKNADWSNTMAYHPIGESLLGGESTILKLTTSMIENKLHEVCQHLALSIIHLASDPKKVARCKLKTQELLSDIKIDNGTTDYVKKIITKSVSAPRLLKIKLGRGGTINNVSYERIAKLLSPMLESTDPLYDIKTTKGSQATVRSLYETIIPKGEWGSNSKTAPYLVSVLNLYYNAAVHLNKIIDLLGDNSSVTKINVLWNDELVNFGTFYKELPNQYTGNSGLESKKKTSPGDDVITSPGIGATFSAASVNSTTNLNTPNFNPVNNQMVNQMVNQNTQGKTMSVTEALNATRQPTFMNPQQMQMPMNMMAGQSQMNMGGMGMMGGQQPMGFNPGMGMMGGQQPMGFNPGMGMMGQSNGMFQMPPVNQTLPMFQSNQSQQGIQPTGKININIR